MKSSVFRTVKLLILGNILLIPYYIAIRKYFYPFAIGLNNRCFSNYHAIFYE